MKRPRKNPPYVLSPRVWLGPMPKIGDDEFVGHHARIWAEMERMSR